MKITSIDIRRLPSGRPTGAIKVESVTGFETTVYLDTLHAERVLGVIEPTVRQLSHEMAVDLGILV